MDGGRARLTAVAIVLGVATVAVALLWQPWDTSDEANAVDFGSATLTLQNSDNRNTLVDRDRLIEAFPLPIQQPEFVPDGYELTMVTFFEGPPGLDRLSFAKNLMARYQGPNSSGLTLSQRPGFGVGTTDVPTEAVTVLGTEAQYVELDRATGIQTLTWARCGRVFMLNSTPLHALSKDDLVRIAESVGPEECPDDPTPAASTEPPVHGRHGTASLRVEDGTSMSPPSNVEEFEAAHPSEILLPSFLPEGSQLRVTTVKQGADATSPQSSPCIAEWAAVSASSSAGSRSLPRTASPGHSIRAAERRRSLNAKSPVRSTSSGLDAIRASCSLRRRAQ